MRSFFQFSMHVDSIITRFPINKFTTLEFFSLSLERICCDSLPNGCEYDCSKFHSEFVKNGCYSVFKFRHVICFQAIIRAFLQGIVDSFKGIITVFNIDRKRNERIASEKNKRLPSFKRDKHSPPKQVKSVGYTDSSLYCTLKVSILLNVLIAALLFPQGWESTRQSNSVFQFKWWLFLIQSVCVRLYCVTSPQFLAV